MWSLNDSQVPVETEPEPMVEDHDEHMVEDKVEDIVEAPKVDDAGMVETQQVQTPPAKATRFEDALKGKVLGCATTMF